MEWLSSGCRPVLKYSVSISSTSFQLLRDSKCANEWVAVFLLSVASLDLAAVVVILYLAMFKKLRSWGWP